MCACRSSDRRGERVGIQEIGFTTINPCDYFSRLGNSVSRWCSTSCREEDGHDGCGCFQHPCFALLSQEGELCIDPETPVPFTGQAVFQGNCFGFCHHRCHDHISNHIDPYPSSRFCEEPSFFEEDGVLPLRGPRVYRVQYNINIPMNADVHTDIHLIVDGETLPGSLRNIEHVAGQPAQSIQADVVVDIDELSYISLVTSSGICLPPEAGDNAIVTMTITALN